MVGTFAAMKEKTLTEPGCKLQIADEDTNPHFGQMWGGEMPKWLGSWQCTAEFLPEPYGTIVSRMCDYASLLRSLYHEGEPAVFHGITVGELNELVHSTVKQLFFHYRRLFPAVKKRRGNGGAGSLAPAKYCGRANGADPVTTLRDTNAYDDVARRTPPIRRGVPCVRRAPRAPRGPGPQRAGRRHLARIAAGRAHRAHQRPRGEWLLLRQPLVTHDNDNDDNDNDNDGAAW